MSNRKRFSNVLTLCGTLTEIQYRKALEDLLEGSLALALEINPKVLSLKGAGGEVIDGQNANNIHETGMTCRGEGYTITFLKETQGTAETCMVQAVSFGRDSGVVSALMSYLVNDLGVEEESLQTITLTIQSVSSEGVQVNPESEPTGVGLNTYGRGASTPGYFSFPVEQVPALGEH